MCVICLGSNSFCRLILTLMIAFFPQITIVLFLPHLPYHLKLKRTHLKALYAVVQPGSRVVIETWEMQVQKGCRGGSFKRCR